MEEALQTGQRQRETYGPLTMGISTSMFGQNKCSKWWKRVKNNFPHSSWLMSFMLQTCVYPWTHELCGIGCTEDKPNF